MGRKEKRKEKTLKKIVSSHRVLPDYSFHILSQSAGIDYCKTAPLIQTIKIIKTLKILTPFQTDGAAHRLELET